MIARKARHAARFSAFVRNIAANPARKDRDARPAKLHIESACVNSGRRLVGRQQNFRGLVAEQQQRLRPRQFDMTSREGRQRRRDMRRELLPARRPPWRKIGVYAVSRLSPIAAIIASSKRASSPENGSPPRSSASPGA